MAPALSFSPPARLVRSASAASDEELKLQELVAPRSAEKEQLLEVELPRSERLAEAQLTSCQVLLASARAAAEVLSAAGSGLQREAASARQSLEAGFFVEQDVHRSNAPDDCRFMESGRCLLAVCEGLGDMLIRLAAGLTGDLMVPLQDLQRQVRVQREQQRLELEKLEQYEFICQHALSESFTRKDKVSLELQDHLQEREGKSRSRPQRAMRWMMKRANPKSESKLHHAAHAQTAAVEELARRVDQVVLARVSREQGAEALCKSLGELSSSRCGLLMCAFNRCAQAWDEGGDSLRALASRLRVMASGESQDEAPGAPGVLSEARAGESPAPDCDEVDHCTPPAPDCDEVDNCERSVSRGSSASPSALTAKQARERIPPLQLSLLQKPEQRLCQDNVAYDTETSDDMSSVTPGEDGCRRIISFGDAFEDCTGSVSLDAAVAKGFMTSQALQPSSKSSQNAQMPSEYRENEESVRGGAATSETVACEQKAFSSCSHLQALDEGCKLPPGLSATASSACDLGSPESREAIGLDKVAAPVIAAGADDDESGNAPATSEIQASQEAEPLQISCEAMSDVVAKVTDGSRDAVKLMIEAALTAEEAPPASAKSASSNGSFVSEVISLSPQSNTTILQDTLK